MTPAQKRTAIAREIGVLLSRLAELHGMLLALDKEEK